MKQTMKRGLALLVAFVLCISLLPVLHLHANAAEFSYVYDSAGKYIYNWGTRGQTATTLSPNAEEFYTGNNTYDVLSAITGGTGTEDAPDSELYAALQKLMKDAHEHQTSYNETRDLYQYTDCQNNGGAISSFYSGNAIGPDWDSGATWNREHTWPQSKGAAGADEDDIMMLRPTASSENTARSNKAYGKSAGYYNPNSASNNTLDLRGDVARVFLYVYVRWGIVDGNNETNAGGQPYTTWGTMGVMESLDVLLEWVEADPVDTWELGRNDSVESITGTRNVFVDYPEMAFLLFGEDVPADMTTPSGEAAEKCGHDNFDAGVPTPASCTTKGYTTYTCQTEGCGYSYKANIVAMIDHDYVSGVCSVCGAVGGPAPVTEIAAEKAYKLGLFSTNKGADYFFTGAMSGYYGATSTDYEKGVDVYLEETTGGHYLYFIDNNHVKQYINLVASGTYVNFSFAPVASSVFVWDEAKAALYTTVGSTVCYMGTYGTYVTMNSLKSGNMQDTDYVARLYAVPAGATTEEPKHSVYFVVPDGVEAVPSMVCGANGVTLPVAAAPAGYTFLGWVNAAKSHVTEAPAYMKAPTTYHANEDVVLYALYSYEQNETVTLMESASISFSSTANRTTFNTSKQVWEQNGITVTNDKASSTSNVANYSNPARFYKGSKLTIAYPGMTKIEVTCSSSSYATELEKSISGATVSKSGSKVTVTLDAPADSFVIAKLGAQVRVSSITVSYPGATVPSVVTYYTTVIGDNACAHAQTDITPMVEATCTEPGHMGNLICSDCQASLSLGQPIAAPGHDWVDHAAVKPTCQQGGNIAYKQCDVCGIYQTAEGAALEEDGWLLDPVSHTVKHADAKAATTEQEGNIEYWYCEECGHAWKDAACTTSISLQETVLPKLNAEQKPTTTPPTGDNNAVVLMGTLMVLSVLAAAVVLTKKDRFTDAQ